MIGSIDRSQKREGVVPEGERTTRMSWDGGAPTTYVSRIGDTILYICRQTTRSLHIPSRRNELLFSCRSIIFVREATSDLHGDCMVDWTGRIKI